MLVVFVHARFSVNGEETGVSFYNVVSHFFSSEISKVAVPFFSYLVASISEIMKNSHSPYIVKS